MKPILAAAAILFLLALNLGCAIPAEKFLGRTLVTYKTPDGTEFLYDSNKNQELLKAKVGFDAQGKIKELDINTTASTPEAAMAAALAATVKYAEIIDGLISKLVTMGAKVP